MLSTSCIKHKSDPDPVWLPPRGHTLHPHSRYRYFESVEKEDETRSPEPTSTTTKLTNALVNGPPTGPRATAMGVLTLSTFLRTLSISQMHKLV